MFDYKTIFNYYFFGKNPPKRGVWNLLILRGIKIFFIRKHRFLVFKMTAQIKISDKKNLEFEKSVMGPRNIQKTVKIWPILDMFSLISWPPCSFLKSYFLCSLSLICAVILNTRNLCFLTTNIWPQLMRNYLISLFSSVWYISRKK